MGFAASLVAFTVGAVLRFATTVHSASFNIRTVGDILMILAVVGMIASALAWASWGGYSDFRRRRGPAAGNTYLPAARYSSSGYRPVPAQPVVAPGPVGVAPVAYPAAPATEVVEVVERRDVIA